MLLNEWDSTGGIDASKEPARHPMLGRIVSAGLFSPLKIETTIDPKLQPFLYDHQIDGTPVLPGVMGIEAFAEAALALLPDWRVEAIEDVNFLAPFKFYRNEPRTVTVEAVIRPLGDRVVAECRLIGHRSLPNQNEPQATTHFTGRVVLTQTAPQPTTVPFAKPAGHHIESSDIYGLYFHGPAYRVVNAAWYDGTQIAGLMANDLPSNHQPSEQVTLVAPRAIETCFQTAGLWEMGIDGRMGLPLHIDRLVFFSEPPAAASQVFAVVNRNADQSFNAEIVDAKSNCYLQMTGYRTVPVPNAVDTRKLNALQTAMTLDLVEA
jgi:hypothetical protein